MIRTCLLCESTSAGSLVRFRPKALICSWCADQLAARDHAFCRKCKAARPLPFGTAHKGAWCAACDQAYMHAKYERSKDARLAYQRAYQEQHRAHELARHRIYRATHRAQINARRRRYAAADPARKHAANLRWRAQHPGYHAASSADWRRRNPDHARLARIRKKLRILHGEGR